MPQVILAVDVGSYSIKIAKAERSLGEFQLTEFHEIPVVPAEGETADQATDSTLNRFFQENSIHYDTAVASLSGLQVSFRLLEFPFLQARKIDAAIEFELENYIPFPIEDLLVDYVIVEKGENRSKVLAVYTPRADFVKFINRLGRANCDPRYVAVETLDLANLYYSGLLPPEGSYLILDIGHLKTNLCLMRGSQIKGARTLALGGKAITEAIAKAYQVDFPQAEQMKIQQGQISGEGEDRLSEAIALVIDELLTQVRQTLFAFYEKGEKSIDAVYLCGGSSRLPGLDQYLSTRMRLNVSPLDVLDYSYTQISNVEEARPVIAPAMALILKAVYPTKTINVNFRREEFAYKRDIQALSGHLQPVAFLALTVFVFGMIYFFSSLYVFKNQEKKINQSVSKLLKQATIEVPKTNTLGAQGALALVQGKIAEEKTQMQKMEGDTALSALEILRLVSASLPPRDELRLDIDNVNITTDHVRLEGRTVDYGVVDQLKAALEKVKLFKNVQTGDVRRGAQDEIKFSLSFEVATNG